MITRIVFGQQKEFIGPYMINIDKSRWKFVV